jgi:hypothetical protein
VEQSYRQIKGELGFSDFQVRRDHAIRRHWELVLCAFCFCWWAYTREHEAVLLDPASDVHSIAEEAGGKRKASRGGRTSFSVVAGSSAAGARMAGAVGNALALLEGVVEGASTATTASAA